MHVHVNQRGCMQMCCVCAIACTSVCVIELIGERDDRWRKLTVSVKNMCQSTHSVAELLGYFECCTDLRFSSEPLLTYKKD